MKFSDKGLTKRTFCAHKDDNKNAVFSSSLEGIHRLDLDTKNLAKNILPELKEYNVIDMEGSLSTELWLATSNAGVIKLKEGKIEYHYSTDNILNSNYVNDIYLDEDEKLWISTAAGINMIDLNSEQIRIITSKDGLISNIVETVLIEDDVVYVGTSNGLNSFDKNNRFSNTSAPPIYINDVTVDGKPNSLKKLNGNEKTFRFYFQGLIYSSLGNFTYR